MASRTIEFLRPTFYGLIAFGLVVGMVNLFWGPSDADDVAGLASSELAGVDLAQIVLPSPALPPERVVRLQLAGLSDGRADGVGILQCFLLASPANRAVTGPLERFGQMVREGPYRCISHPRAILVGRPEQEDDVARLLVTVMDEHSAMQAFTFVLVKQQDAPFKDCWMTEAVLSALPPAPAPEKPAPSPTS